MAKTWKEIGARIKADLANDRGGQKRLALRADFSEAALSRYLSGDRTPDLDDFLRLAHALGLPVSELLGEPPVVQETVKTIEHETVLTADEQELVRVPLVAREVAAGHGAFPQPVDSRFYYFRSDSVWDMVGPGASRKDRLAVVFLDPRQRFGESMMPTIQPGSLLLIDREIKKIDDRGIYLVEYPSLGEDGPLAVKRLTLNGKKRILVAESDNPDPAYAPVMIDLEEDDLRWEHVVKGKVILWSTESRLRKPQPRLKVNGSAGTGR